jgi:hypothetical protein
MTREQQREYLRQRVFRWMDEVGIERADPVQLDKAADWTADMILKHWLRTRERLPGDFEMSLEDFCDTFDVALNLLAATLLEQEQ